LFIIQVEIHKDFMFFGSKKDGSLTFHFEIAQIE